MSCSHTKTFGKSHSKKNAITATVTGLRLSRIKHWNPLASNPGYPFQILSRSFGEKSCFSFRILSHNFGEKSCFPFWILSHNFGEKLCFPFRILSRSFGEKNNNNFSPNPKIQNGKPGFEVGNPLSLCHSSFSRLQSNTLQRMYQSLLRVHTIHSQAGINKFRQPCT